MPTPPDTVDAARRLAVLGLAAAGIGAARAAGTRRVVRALVESWPPYLYPGEGQAVRGLDAELLVAICQRAGYEVSWVRAPIERRKRRYEQLLSDQFDVIFSATPVPDKLGEVMYTQPYRREIMMVAAPVVHDSTLELVRDFNDVLKRRVRLLHVEADGLGKEFEASRQALADAGLLVRYATGRQGVEMLRAGRAALILGDALDLQEQARQLGFPLVRQAYGYSETPVSLMLSRKRLNEADLRRINQAITELEQRGVLAAIRSRYAVQAGAASGGSKGSRPMDFRPSR
ncbi:transporter substrate-binding domain-containing protein [Paucibacter sp. R3-3]|uniref:Transporter substrate-binding domain-containing protein n=2 Tax=Roseateles agri TaxID=3098619 RepID=A0ABU5DMM6_9BURK|nr:transporter substrate-binding domain-containing protein [Paucibacter sp. R3-3]